MSFRSEDLHVFGLVCELKSFQKAAHRSGLTQSAVTKVVRKLEAHFAVNLLERGAQLSMTPAGRTLYARAVDSRALNAALESEMAAERGATGGSIRLGAVPALLQTLVLPVVAQFLARDPLMKILVSVQLTDELLARVTNGSLDLAVGFEATHVPPEVVNTVVGTQKYCIAGRTGHSLTGRPVTAGELAQAQWLLPTRDVALRQRFERTFADAGFENLNIRVEADSSATWFAPLLKGSDLLGLFAEQSFKAQPISDLALIDAHLPGLTGQITLLHRRRTPSSGLFIGLKAELTRRAELIAATFES